MGVHSGISRSFVVGSRYFKMKERHSVKDHPYFECAEKVDQIFGTIAKDRAVLKD